MSIPPAPRQPIAFVDTSAIVALVDRDDATHKAAVDAYYTLLRDGYRLFTTNHVVSETFDLLHGTLGPAVAQQWLANVDLPIYVTDPQDEERARQRLLSNGRSRPMRFSDAMSLCVMERLGVADAFAVDPEFLDHLS